MAADVEVDEVRAELLLSDKADGVAEPRSRYRHVAMVGDGVNDAQAMASSTLGIALGGSGVDVVMEAADVVLVSGAIAIALKAAFLVLTFFWLGYALDGHRRRHGGDVAGEPSTACGYCAQKNAQRQG